MTGQICLPIASLKAKIGLGIVAFAILSGLVLSKPARNLQDFDQVFYATLAYDLDRYGVFSNGPFSGVDGTVTPPPPACSLGRSIRRWSRR